MGKVICIDCGKKISDYRHIRCNKCSSKQNPFLFTSENSTGKNNLAYKDGRTSKLYNCKICDNPIDYHAYFIRKKLCKYCSIQLRSYHLSILYQKHRTHCIICGQKISARCKSTKCHSCATKKRWKENPKSHPWFGNSPFSGRYYKYKNISFHSSWEANFAKWCDLSGIKWKYEPKTFSLEDTTYTPDFYLPEFDCWIEIKGYLHEDAKIKINLFKNKYKKLNFIMFKKEKLKEIGVLNG